MSFFGSSCRADLECLLAVIADYSMDFSGNGLPLACTGVGHAGVRFAQGAYRKVDLAFTDSANSIAQGDRVLVVGLVQGK